MKNILFVASECVPFIKTGGLADVVGSLPKYFPKEYFDVRVVIPKYAGIKEQFRNQMQYVTNFYMDLNWRQQYVGIFEMEYEGIKFYFIDNEEHFGGSTPYAGMPWDLEKFAYFSKAALSILPTIGFRPDLIHCHDWQTGLVPVYLHERFQADEFYRGIKTVMTIHNLKFQGIWDRKTIQSITGLSDYYFTFFIGWEAFYYGWGRVFFCAAMVPLVLLFLCAFAAQCKAGTVLRSALIARIARFLWRIVRSLFLGLWRIAKSLPLIWKTALAGLILVFIESVLFIQDYYGTLAAPFLALKLAELLAVLYVAVNLRTLQKGGEKLANGDFSSPIDTKYLIGDFKRYGQELNDVQSGLEQAVQEQMKAEHLKTELITNVSHDIKTPLTSIVNYVDLLKKEDIPSPEAREYIAVLDRQSHRLKKLTEDLVEASKASSGVLNVDLQPTDVNVLFSQIEGEYQERLAACQLTLVTQPPAPGTVIRADSRLLSRVMDNLVSNICKYALPSTRVYVVSTLSREAVTISFKNVSRDELNISPDELMERFVRGDASRHTEGSGLGLSIARSLVQLQGGRFDLAIDADLFRADITFPLSETPCSAFVCREHFEQWGKYQNRSQPFRA